MIFFDFQLKLEEGRTKKKCLLGTMVTFLRLFCFTVPEWGKINSHVNVEGGGAYGGMRLVGDAEMSNQNKVEGGKNEKI